MTFVGLDVGAGGGGRVLGGNGLWRCVNTFEEEWCRLDALVGGGDGGTGPRPFIRPCQDYVAGVGCIVARVESLIGCQYWLLG